MKRNSIIFTCLMAAAITVVIVQSSCSGEPVQAAAAEETAPTKAQLVERGQYLVTVSLCNDCHTPKVFGPHGMGFDSTRIMSGFRAGSPIPPVNKKSLEPGQWISFGPELTMAVGPWGMSFAANLSPDSATGIGAWTADVFMKTLRTGKHLGHENGRPIMPPMPWEFVGKMSDEDLTAIYTYLQALPPISNRVPAPISPEDVAKMN